METGICHVKTKLAKMLQVRQRSGKVSLLAVFTTLSYICYFLLPSDSANNFPTYITALIVASTLISGLPLRIKESIVFRCVLILLAYLIFSAFWSADYKDRDVLSLVGNVWLIVTMILGIHICEQSILKFCDFTIKLLVISATLSCSLFLLQLLHDPSVSLPLGRWHTTSVAAIGYGMAMVLACYLLINTESLLEKVVYGFCLALMLGTQAQLSELFVWYAFAFSLALLSLGKVWDLRYSRSAFGWVLFCVFVLSSLLSILDLVLESDRQLIWQSVVNSIYKASPIFGEGVLSSVYPSVDCNESGQLLDKFGDCVFQHPHNLYISTMYYGGIVGLVLLLGLLIASVGVVLESKSAKKWLVLAMLGYGAAVFIFDGNYLISKINYVWLLLWLPVSFAIKLELDEKVK